MSFRKIRWTKVFTIMGIKLVTETEKQGKIEKERNPGWLVTNFSWQTFRQQGSDNVANLFLQVGDCRKDWNFVSLKADSWSRGDISIRLSLNSRGTVRNQKLGNIGLFGNFVMKFKGNLMVLYYFRINVPLFVFLKYLFLSEANFLK